MLSFEGGDLMVIQSTTISVIEQEVGQAINLLAIVELTKKINIRSFPFAYHHDFVRRSSIKMGREDIGKLMFEFRDKYGERTYIRRVIYGALLFIMAEYPVYFARALHNYDFAFYFARLSYAHKELVFQPSEIK